MQLPTIPQKPKFALRMQPLHMPIGSLDEVATAATREELIKQLTEDRCPAYNTPGFPHFRHFKKASPFANYHPINPEVIGPHGEGIVEDSTKIPLDGKEFAQLQEVLRGNPGTHPVLIHRLAATIEALVPEGEKAAA